MINKEIIRFLIESNKIEEVGEEGLNDSIKAFVYLMQVSVPLTQKHILKTHRLLMQNLNPEIAGKIRNCLVTVGGKFCPRVDEIPHLMSRFLEIVNTKRKEDIENYCKLSHIYFENMHPFEDGNGRVGRLLLNWQRKQYNLPLLTIEYKTRWEYYNWFL